MYVLCNWSCQELAVYHEMNETGGISQSMLVLVYMRKTIGSFILMYELKPNHQIEFSLIFIYTMCMYEWI